MLTIAGPDRSACNQLACGREERHRREDDEGTAEKAPTMPRKARSPSKSIPGILNAGIRARAAVTGRYMHGWHDVYLRLRLRCPRCEGYLIYAKRCWSSNQSRRAFCANECHYHMHWTEYCARKEECVLYELTGVRPPQLWPYFLLPGIDSEALAGAGRVHVADAPPGRTARG